MLCRQRPDLSDLSIRTQEGILVKNSKNISIKELIAEKAIYLVFIILLVAIVVVEPRFLSFNNFKNIFAQSSTKIIIALAAGMVLVVQGVDLSTGRMIGLAAVIFASLVLCIQNVSEFKRASADRSIITGTGNLSCTWWNIRCACCSI